MIITSILLVSAFLWYKKWPPVEMFNKVVMVSIIAFLSLLKFVATTVSAGVISGVTAIIIVQLTAAPLRPVKLREAFLLLRKRWRPFLKTLIRVTLWIILGLILLIIPGMVMWMRYSLYAPVVLIEGLQGKAAMRRARELASRSWKTVIIVAILQFLIPAIVSSHCGLHGRTSKSREELNFRADFSAGSRYG